MNRRCKREAHLYTAFAWIAVFLFIFLPTKLFALPPTPPLTAVENLAGEEHPPAPDAATDPDPEESNREPDEGTAPSIPHEEPEKLVGDDQPEPVHEGMQAGEGDPPEPELTEEEGEGAPSFEAPEPGAAETVADTTEEAEAQEAAEEEEEDPIDWGEYIDVEIISGPDGDFPMVERPDHQFIILELRLPRIILNSGLPAFMTDDMLLLPLGALSSAAGFPIMANVDTGIAQGWFMEEKNTFHLNIARNELVIRGKPVNLEPHTAEVQFDDIYVSQENIEQWFNISLELDYGNMRLTLTSPTPLPLEEKLERARMQARLRKMMGEEGPIYQVHHPKYLLFSMPSHDVRLDLAAPFPRKLQAEPWRFRTVPQGNSYYARGAGDLLYMHGTWTVMGNEFDLFSKANLRLERSDPAGKMGGVLGLTNIAVGDIISPQIHLVTRGIQGRGVQFTNQPLTKPSTFDRITMEGFTTPGWEIELHRNEVLLDYQVAGQDGRYFFEDVPLTFGVNNITLYFFGPHGEVHKEEKALFIGPGMIKEGERQFRFSVSQNELDLFNVSSRRPVSLSTGDPRLILEYEHGLSDFLSIASHFATVPVYENQHYYGGLGLRTSFKQLYAIMDAIINAPNGVAAHMALHTQFWKLNLVAEHAHFFGDFTSEQFLSRGDPMEARSRIRLNGVLRFGTSHLNTFPYSLEAQNDLRKSGFNLTRINHRISARFLGATFTHSLNWLLTTMGRNSTFGALSIVRRGHKFSPLGQIVYEPTEGVHLYRVGADIRIRRHLMTRVEMTHQLIDTTDITLRAGLNYRFARLAMGVNGGMSSRGGASAGISLSTGFTWDPNYRSLDMTSSSPSSSGSVAPMVFWDKNLSGQFEEDIDALLNDVSFTVNNTRKHRVRTDEKGTTILGELPPHAYANLEIDRKSLIDPFLIPVPDGVSLVTRPGRVEILPLSVVMTGEVDGMVYLHQGSSTFPAGGMKLSLLDESNNVVSTVESTFDGFYLFDFIKPGTYSLQMDQEQLKALGMVHVNPIANLHIDGTGSILSDQIVILEPAEGTPGQEIFITDK